MRHEDHRDLTRTVLLVAVIVTLLVGSFLTLRPFLGGLIWATTIAIATWPALVKLRDRLGGRRGLAVAAMTLLVVVAFILPFALAASVLIDAARHSPTVMNDFLERGLGPPPAWLPGVPVVGQRVNDEWRTIAAGGPEALAAAVQPYGRAAAAWALTATGGFGKLLLLVLLTLALTPILYARGETAARGGFALAHRLGGASGERTLRLAGQAIRSVALGVVLTALLQSALAGAGLWIAGVPHPVVLAALAFVLGIAQLGPLLVLVPAVLWLYWTDRTGWAIALFIYSVPVGMLDNVLRPILIRRGVQLPLLLIISGVIGGLISFGVIGLFVGPVVLAATYTLAVEWVASPATDDARPLPGPAGLPDHAHPDQ